MVEPQNGPAVCSILLLHGFACDAKQCAAGLYKRVVGADVLCAPKNCTAGYFLGGAPHDGSGRFADATCRACTAACPTNATYAMRDTCDGGDTHDAQKCFLCTDVGCECDPLAHPDHGLVDHLIGSLEVL